MAEIITILAPTTMTHSRVPRKTRLKAKEATTLKEETATMFSMVARVQTPQM